MAENIRALLVIWVIAFFLFSLSHRFWQDLSQTAARDFLLQRKLWFGLTTLAFMAGSYWLYAGAMLLVCWLGRQRVGNVIALYVALLFVIPPFPVAIPGFGLMQQVFELTHPRLLALGLLLPMAWRLYRQPAKQSTRSICMADRCLQGYLLLLGSLALAREDNLTNGLRQCWYLFLDVALPYYVTSRALQTPATLRETVTAWIGAGLLLAGIGSFETLRHWLLYNALPASMGLRWDMGLYLGRADTLRASASTGHAIALGYVVSVAGLFFVSRWPTWRTQGARLAAAAVLLGGWLAPLSRGPWIGGMAMLAAYVATGPNARRRLLALGLTGAAALAVAAVLPGGDKVIAVLPFIGTVEASNIDYRSRLLEMASVVAARNPWLGSDNFLKTPEMQSLIQGQGIIDIVNTYLQILLTSGLIGLILFVGIFLAVGWRIYRLVPQHPNRNDDPARLGRTVLATLIGTMVTIFTTSSITVIPTVYWCLLGLGTAYGRVMGAVPSHARHGRPGYAPDQRPIKSDNTSRERALSKSS